MGVLCVPSTKLRVISLMGNWKVVRTAVCNPINSQESHVLDPIANTTNKRNSNKKYLNNNYPTI
jgi:hypothetical protein